MLKCQPRLTQLRATTWSLAAFSLQSNVVFSFAAARTPWEDSTPELKFVMGMASGPAFFRESKGKELMKFYVVSALATSKVAENQSKLSHHQFAPKRRWNSANA
jgi:hypothetical protein